MLNYSNNSIDLLWNGDVPNYKYKYMNNKIYFTLANPKEVIEGDISNTVKSLETQQLRFEPLSINDFLNGTIKLIITEAGAQDYNRDSYDEIITKHDMYNVELGMYLSSIYNVWKMKNESVYIYKSFIIDLHNFEARLISEIIENGYLSTDNTEELESLLDKKADEKDYIPFINKLVQKEIIKVQNSTITIN